MSYGAVGTEFLVLVKHFFAEVDGDFLGFFVDCGLKVVGGLLSLEEVSLKHADIEDLVRFRNQLHLMVEKLKISIRIMASNNLILWDILGIFHEKLVIFVADHSVF